MMNELILDDWFDQILEQKRVITEVVETCGAFWNMFTEKEKKFLESVAEQVKILKILSEKQMEWVNNLKERIKKGSEAYDQWIGRKIYQGFMKKKFGTEKIGAIVAFHYMSKSGRAIYCDIVMLEQGQMKSVKKEAWIPISQVSRERIV